MAALWPDSQTGRCADEGCIARFNLDVKCMMSHGQLFSKTCGSESQRFGRAAYSSVLRIRLSRRRENAWDVSQVRKHLRLVMAGVLLAIPLLYQRRAEAQIDPWEFEVLPYSIEPRGMIELETNNAVVASGHSKGGNGTAAGTFASNMLWYNACELTYGLT